MSKNTITFAIGDIHGMHDQFRRIIQKIFAYIRDTKVEDWKIITIGDYIDRGPNSSGVVQSLIDLQNMYPGKVITLRGNHEAMLLDCLVGGKDEVELFEINGGDATLKSYGVSAVKDIPFSHKQFFRDTLLHYEDDLRYFVHAGVQPFLELSKQIEHDKLWIRYMFLEHKEPFEKFIVHGHSVKHAVDKQEKPEHRFNLDYGAVFGGSLVCALFNNKQANPYFYFVETAA